MSQSKKLDIVAVMELIEEAAAAPPGSVTADLDLPGMEGWDSLGMVMFAELIEDRTGLALEHGDFRDCLTATAFCERIAERLSEASAVG